MSAAPLIALCTDYGVGGPYNGILEAVLAEHAPAVPRLRLFTDLPPCNPRAAAPLLAAYAADLPAASVVLAVVDPGVGTGAHRPVIVRADGRWYCGPHNGLFDTLLMSGREPWMAEILWRPQRLSASFHGRDLYAPVAAMLARGELPAHRSLPPRAWDRDAAADLPMVVYVDAFGNALTGLRAAAVDADAVLRAGGRRLERRGTFGEAAEGEPFWHVNANGLVEIAANRASAAALLGLAVGSPVAVGG